VEITHQFRLKVHFSRNIINESKHKVTLQYGRYLIDFCCLRDVEKKLRCCEEHSASVVLSWCSLWYFSTKNPL